MRVRVTPAATAAAIAIAVHDSRLPKSYDVEAEFQRRLKTATDRVIQRKVDSLLTDIEKQVDTILATEQHIPPPVSSQIASVEAPQSANYKL